jgi:hypothetical protein
MGYAEEGARAVEVKDLKMEESGWAPRERILPLRSSHPGERRAHAPPGGPHPILRIALEAVRAGGRRSSCAIAAARGSTCFTVARASTIT